MEKLYFSISEVSRIVDEESYVLRYWEKEFPFLSPRKNNAGNRAYTLKDIKTVKAIQHLLRNQKMTLAEAKIGFKDLDINTFDFDISGYANLFQEPDIKSQPLTKRELTEILSIFKDTINLLK